MYIDWLSEDIQQSIIIIILKPTKIEVGNIFSKSKLSMLHQFVNILVFQIKSATKNLNICY